MYKFETKLIEAKQKQPSCSKDDSRSKSATSTPQTKPPKLALTKSAACLVDAKESKLRATKAASFTAAPISPPITKGSANSQEKKKPGSSTHIDNALPEFDPAKFSPGYIPKTVMKGAEEYMIVVSGVKDTGLCGGYWGKTENLGSRRLSSLPTALDILKATPMMRKTPGTKKRVTSKLNIERHQNTKQRNEVNKIKSNNKEEVRNKKMTILRKHQETRKELTAFYQRMEASTVSEREEKQIS